MHAVQNAECKTVAVKSIEGSATYGDALQVKPLIAGETMALLEIRYAAGSGAPPHVHDHESVVYVVKGRVRTLIDSATHDLGPGDACRHPAGVAHAVEALEDAVIVEIKSPRPDLAVLFGS